jgi:hypothetical protein
MIKKFEDFISKVAGQTVLVDVDGTLVPSQRIPADVVKTGFGLAWWRENLQAVEINSERAEMLVALKNAGCKIVIWTDRFPEHEEITKQSLGKFVNLVDEFSFNSGTKKIHENEFAIDDKISGENVLRVERI